MPAFAYRAADRAGAEKKGLIEATSAAAARGMLREQGLLPLAVDPAVERDRAARLLATDYGVQENAITVALPGTDRVSPAAGSKDGVVRLLSVGAIVPRKGYDVLIPALAALRDLPWRLTIAGARDRDADAGRGDSARGQVLRRSSGQTRRQFVVPRR